MPENEDNPKRLGTVESFPDVLKGDYEQWGGGAAVFHQQLLPLIYALSLAYRTLPTYAYMALFMQLGMLFSPGLLLAQTGGSHKHIALYRHSNDWGRVWSHDPSPNTHLLLLSLRISLKGFGAHAVGIAPNCSNGCLRCHSKSLFQP